MMIVGIVLLVFAFLFFVLVVTHGIIGIIGCNRELRQLRREYFERFGTRLI